MSAVSEARCSCVDPLGWIGRKRETQHNRALSGSLVLRSRPSDLRRKRTSKAELQRKFNSEQILGRVWVTRVGADVAICQGCAHQTASVFEGARKFPIQDLPPTVDTLMRARVPHCRKRLTIFRRRQLHRYNLHTTPEIPCSSIFLLLFVHPGAETV